MRIGKDRHSKFMSEYFIVNNDLFLFKGVFSTALKLNV